MGRHQCEGCGERFNSEYHLELHQDMHDCSDASESTTSDANDDTFTIAGGSKITDVEGTVSEFNQDRGFGFITTVDVGDHLVEADPSSVDVFVHISDVSAAKINTGDRVRFDVVEGSDGLQAKECEITLRNMHRDSYDEPADRKSSLGFGQQVDDTKYGPGKSGPTESDIEDFADEDKFR
jgi:cold shock CspA family protein